MPAEVSVIVPVYNAEKTICQCMDALTHQSWPRKLYEIIVVDDGSEDKTASLLKNYPAKYLYQDNSGPAAARNNGADEAVGNIILFTDSDCVPDKEWIRQMVKPFEDAAIIAVKGAYRSKQSSLVSQFVQLEFEERYEMLKKAKSIDMIDTHSAGFRRKVFLEMEGFDTSFPAANNEDTELSYRMSRDKYRMVFNPEAIVHHLRHPDSVAKYCKLKFWRAYWRMVVYKKFPKKAFKDTYTPQTLKLQIAFLYMSLAMLICAVAIPSLILLSALSLMVFGLLTLPFGIFAVRRDLRVALLSPLFLLMRAAALGAGMIWYLTSRNVLLRTKSRLTTI